MTRSGQKHLTQKDGGLGLYSRSEPVLIKDLLRRESSRKLENSNVTTNPASGGGASKVQLWPGSGPEAGALLSSKGNAEGRDYDLMAHRGEKH